MKLILISLVALVAVMMVACGGGGGSGPLNVALEDLFQEFVDDVDAASDKYHDKDILVSGEVDSVENAHLVWEKPYINIIVPGASFPSPWVVCLLSDEALSKDISSGDNISVEGKVYIAAMTSLLIEAGPEAFELILNNCSPGSAVGTSTTSENQHDKGVDYASARAHNDEGVSYYQKAQWENAIPEFDKAIQIDPDYADAYRGRGNAYWRLAQFQNAVDDHTMALQIDPDDALAYVFRGQAYLNLGQTANADADKAKACSLDSQYC